MEKIKLFTLFTVALLITGCQKNYRTGSICIEPFSTNNYKTSNPVEVKQDIVDAINEQIPPALRNKITENSKLIIDTDCTRADYKLTGSLTAVNTALQGSSGKNFFLGGRWHYTQRSFGVGIICSIKNNNTLETILRYENYEHSEDLEETLDNLADEIVDQIKYGKQ